MFRVPFPTVKSWGKVSLRQVQANPMPARGRPILFLALASVAMSWPRIAGAEQACDGNDLLAAATVLASPGIAGSSHLAHDGQVASEGGRWDTALALRFVAPDAALVFDLGAARTVRSALVQADADDDYWLEGSQDAVTFLPLGRVGALPASAGLRTRAVPLSGSPVRYLRVRASGGDGRASLAEIQLFCTAPDGWKPRLETVDIAPQPERPGPLPGWNDLTSRWWQLALALGSLLFLRLAHRAERDSNPRSRRRWDRAFAVALGLAILTYFNFGFFHFSNFIHNWDTFHYYIGAKYFPELRYDGLYDCVAVADARSSDPATRSRVAGRTIRDLRTNELVAAATVLGNPGRCTARFSEGRFRSFERDVAWFRERESPERWDELSADHGFNASPVWMIAGSWLANLAPAGDASMHWLAAIDPLYFLAMAAALVWGFGARAASVALLVLATSFPSRFFWTGGSFLRWDWLFFLVAAVALARRGKPLLGGACLACSALLRLFPLGLALGPALAIAWAAARAWRAAPPGERLLTVAAAMRAPASRPAARFLAGMALLVTVALPWSLAVTSSGPGRSGLDAWRQFLGNTEKHSRTPLTNNMGLMTALTFRPAEIGRALHDERAREPWARWKQARLASRERMRWPHRALALGTLIAVALAVRRHHELWVTLALSAAWIPFALEMTSYYFAFLVVPALLWRERRNVGMLLLALSACGQLLSLAPFAGMPTWRDEVYSWLSIATIMALAIVLATFARPGPTVPTPAVACLNSR
mgnify:CR=1 FL=1